MTSIYDFSCKTSKGEPKKLKEYAGKVLLIVNTASKCGFTPQFEGLEALHEKHAARGLAILGFPCNQFGGQEPGSSEDIAEFCSATYGVTFPMSEKVEVNGDVYAVMRERDLHAVAAERLGDSATGLYL